MGFILFNFYTNDLFLFIKQGTLYNYADDKTLNFFSKTLSNLIGLLEEEAGVANPEKFHAMLVRKDQTNLSEEYLNIKGEPIKT